MSSLFNRLSRSRSSSPPHSHSQTRKSAPAPPLMDPLTIARISRRKLAAAASGASASGGRDSLELRRVVLIQGAMHAASAAASRSPSPTRSPASSAYAQHPVTVPEIIVTAAEQPSMPPVFGLEELEAEERWFDAVLGELDPDWDEEDAVVSIVTVQEADPASDGTVSETGSDGFPNLDDFFYPPPPPYSYSPTPSAHTQSVQQQLLFDASYPPPLPDSFAADAWDEYDDGSEKVNLATLFSDVDFSVSVPAHAHSISIDIVREKPDYASQPPIVSYVVPPGYGVYPPISPYELVWPSARYDYDAAVY